MWIQAVTLELQAFQPGFAEWRENTKHIAVSISNLSGRHNALVLEQAERDLERTCNRFITQAFVDGYFPVGKDCVDLMIRAQARQNFGHLMIVVTGFAMKPDIQGIEGRLEFLKVATNEISLQF